MKISEYSAEAQREMTNILRIIQMEAWQTSENHGFHADIEDNGATIYLLAKLMLITTEVAEAAEALRNDDEDNFTEELADIGIRLFDLAGITGSNLGQAIIDKMIKNEGRERMHGKIA